MSKSRKHDGWNVSSEVGLQTCSYGRPRPRLQRKISTCFALRVVTEEVPSCRYYSELKKGEIRAFALLAVPKNKTVSSCQERFTDFHRLSPGIEVRPNLTNQEHIMATNIDSPNCRFVTVRFISETLFHRCETTR
ncbi:hypothetical protein R1flu_020024 [Riccia fluitans]|uniref:Uncharacterized protein n=1 Tax=Riccia fluitans TaxID=41844 RepID=A0ABD1ZLY9_9MARC